MKGKNMKANRIHIASNPKAWLAIPLAILLWLPAMLTSAHPNNRPDGWSNRHSRMGPGIKQTPMAQRWRLMQKRREHLLRQMKRNNAKLDKLLAAMNRATGPRKVGAIAAVVNLMARQRMEMEHEMAKMRPPMAWQMPPGRRPLMGSSRDHSRMNGMMGGGMMGNRDASSGNKTH